MPTIPILLRPPYQSSSYWVQVKVTDQGQKIFFFLTDDGLVSTLKEMPNFMVSPVEVLSIGLLQTLHEFRQRLPGDLQQKMDMVGHEAVSIENETVLLSIFG